MKIDVFFDRVGDDPRMQQLIEMLQNLPDSIRAGVIRGLKESRPEDSKFLAEFFCIDVVYNSESDE